MKADNKAMLFYLVRYNHQSADQDKWLPAEKKMVNAKVTLSAFRGSNRDQGPMNSA